MSQIKLTLYDDPSYCCVSIYSINLNIFNNIPCIPITYPASLPITCPASFKTKHNDFFICYVTYADLHNWNFLTLLHVSTLILHLQKPLAFSALDVQASHSQAADLDNLSGPFLHHLMSVSRKRCTLIKKANIHRYQKATFLFKIYMWQNSSSKTYILPNDLDFQINS